MNHLQDQNKVHSLQAPADSIYTIPTSFAQQRLWFLDRLLGAGSLYNMSWAIQLNGKLDVSALQQSLNAIVARHEVLRTCFSEQDGEPVQVIRTSMPFASAWMDLSALPQENRASEIQRILDAEANKAFDLKQTPLIRALLLKLSEQEHILLVTVHQSVADGWSMDVFRQELASLYGAFSQGQAANLPELPIQYTDYAVRQREWLQGEVLEQQLGYWKSQLADLSVLELPTDRPRPKQQSYRGARETIQLSAALTQSLETLSQQHNVTLFMTLLAAFQVLLHRYSGQDDIVVGTAIVGRNRQELENLIGFFANTLALRTDLSGAPSFVGLLSRVHQVCLNAYAHQTIPFEKLVDELQVQRDMSRHPLFQVMLVLQPATLLELQLPGLTINKLTPTNETAKFDLALSFAEHAEGLTGTIEYSTDLFNAGTIIRLIGHFQTLLAAIVENPETAIIKLPLLTAPERHQLLVEWNATKTDYPKDKCIHQLFEEQVERIPDALAVLHEGYQVSYAELNTRANRLAHHLKNMGVGSDDRVAISVERGVDMLVGMLAILKAGGAYVPLDPNYPAERLAYILEDSAPKALLTQTGLHSLWTGVEDMPIVLLDTENPIWANYPAININPGNAGLTPSNLVFVIYTSGSTGKQKGVMVEHRNLVNLVHWHCAAFQLRPGRYSSCVASLGFVAAAWEIWPTLCAGAGLVLPPASASRNPEALLSWWKNNQIVNVSFLPTPLAEIAFSNEVAKTGLRTLLVGGDRLRHVPLHTLPFSLINNYGLTETTSAAISGRLSPSDAVIHIGRPIANTQIYILDTHGEPVPIGLTGELYIGGAGIARGYLGHPELTAERFLTDPFVSEPAVRMYKTGDLGRWLADGKIEFLGRNDFQVKIRGFRIELGEIEARLVTHPKLREAVVLARDGEFGDKQLVAYYTGDEDLAITDLRAHLALILPDYMVPAAYVRLEVLPLTPNGKLDRKALPVPGNKTYATRAYEAPQGETEQALASLWSELLKIERVGRHDNFFELGGHSLLAMQLIVRINKQFQTDFPLYTLFETPTVAGLSLPLEVRLKQEISYTITSIKGLSRSPYQMKKESMNFHQEQNNGHSLQESVEKTYTFPTSFAQQRLWFLDRLLGASGLYNIHWTIQLNGKLDVPALQKSLNAIVVRHESLRTYFIEQDGEPVQAIRASIPFACTLMDLSAHPQENRDSEIQRILHTEGDKPFDLNEAPLLRASLLKLSEQEHVLLICVHHIVFDGWSRGVFKRDLTSLYFAYSQGQSASLPELPIQYADYAVWQREWFRDDVLERQLSYWKTQLTDLTPLELPTDRPRPKQQSYRGAREAIQLSAKLTRGLKALSQQQNVTLFMTLLAALQVLLHRYSGQDDIVVGTAIAGRNRQEIENLIGFFVNTLVLRTNLSGTPNFCQLLSRVREVCLSAYTYQDMPFEKLVAELQVQRDMSRHPLFQVMLVLQPTALQDMQLPGLAISNLTVTNETAKFDLLFWLAEHPDGLTGTIEYSTDLFNTETIIRLAGHFQRLLEAIVDYPGTAIAEFPLLTAPERHKLLVEWNATQTDYLQDKYIHHLFEEQVEKTPDAIAVVFGSHSLTYKKLNEQANKLAHYLRNIGVGPEARVGICLERSLDMVVGLLGILKAGGAYVPLDPAYPKERLAFMMEDSAPLALLTQSRFGPLLAGLKKTFPVIDLSAKIPRWVDQPDSNPDHNSVGLIPENLVNILYTSGSTGKPKGVGARHQGLQNLLPWYIREFNLSCDDAVLVVTSLSYDLTQRNIFGPLLVGARLVLAGEPFDPQAVVTLVAREHISLMNLTPSTFYALITASTNGELGGLRCLILGGEPVQPFRLLELPEPRPKFVNGYGPTECTGVITYHQMSPDLEQYLNPNRAVPIGRPIANTRIYILDAYQQPVPIGVVGEIHIGGAPVGRGYLNQPELTAECFVRDPFVPGTDARMYKTGDLGRWFKDGVIELLGRKDFQVKLRGFRIELGEIEAVLGQYPGINEVVVTVREDQPGDKRLIAYLTHSQLEPPNLSALRLFLKEKLPDYMVPSAFVVLDKLPLTPNGKIDRKALPAPEQTHPENEQTYVPPHLPVEEMLAALWREVLNIDRIGIHDNFFELGGHSLLAVQLIVRINKQFQIELPLQILFEEPTIAGLSVQLETVQKQKNLNAIVPIKALPRKRNK